MATPRGNSVPNPTKAPAIKPLPRPKKAARERQDKPAGQKINTKKMR